MKIPQVKNMKKLFIILFPLLIIAAISGCGDAKSKPLANVDGKVVTVGDFEKRLAKLPPYYRTIASQRKKDFLEDLIAEQLLYGEAKRRGLNRDGEVKELINEARKKILVAKLIEIETGKKSPAREDEVKAYYETHKDEFVTPIRLRASHILIHTESEAKEILQKLGAGVDFAQLAREYSKDPSKEKGGDIGYFSRGQLIPEFENVCFSLEVGEVSDIVKTQLGYHIIKLTEKKEPATKELSEVRSEIEKNLRDQTERESFEKLVKGLRAKSHVKINEGLLKDVEVKPSKGQLEPANSSLEKGSEGR